MARLRGHSGLTDRGLVRGASAPSGAAIGQMWFNTGTGVLYKRTANVDGSSFWLDISSSGIGTSANRGVDFVGDIDPHKATNGSGLAVGSVYYNREKNSYFVCTDATSGANVWSGRYAGAGGTEADVLIGSTYYKIHKFTSSGTFSVEDAMNVDWLVVAGGGGGGTGGARGGGGGGAGGFRTGASLAVTAQTYSVTVGSGGDGAVNGNDSVFSTITSTGGGKGGEESVNNAGDGGSGGGGSGSATTGAGAKVNITPITGEVTTVQGFNGGAGRNGNDWPGGGGGGAGAVGAGPSSQGNGTNNAGGVGEDQVMGLNAADSYTLLTAASAGHVVGGARYFSGGGGGAVGTGGTNGAGGSGGGGVANSGNSSTLAGNGLANTGGGGGGHGYGGTNNAGDGGSGIVIIRYALS